MLLGAAFRRISFDERGYFLELKSRLGKEGVFSGIVSRRGQRDGRSANGYQTLPTVCLAEVRNEDGEIVADHVWIDATRALRRAIRGSAGRRFRIGEKVTFRAVVKPYEKGKPFELLGSSDYGFVNIRPVPKD